MTDVINLITKIQRYILSNSIISLYVYSTAASLIKSQRNVSELAQLKQ